MAEMQSVYSAAPADWATKDQGLWSLDNLQWVLSLQIPLSFIYNSKYGTFC